MSQKGELNPKQEELEEIYGLVSLLHHHVSHFLLGSRLAEAKEGYHIAQLEKAIRITNELIKKINKPEQLLKLQTFQKKINNIDINAAKDLELLDEVQSLFKEFEDSFKN